MGYETTQKKACFMIKDRQEGEFITKWHRIVGHNEDGTPNGDVRFEALCESDVGEGRCDLVWKTEVSSDGTLVLKYTCSNINCVGADGDVDDRSCILQYSKDDKEYKDVTADEPPADADVYFRCRCGGGA